MASFASSEQPYTEREETKKRDKMLTSEYHGEEDPTDVELILASLSPDMQRKYGKFLKRKDRTATNASAPDVEVSGDSNPSQLKRMEKSKIEK